MVTGFVPVILGLCCAGARGAERLSLVNGMEVECHHHALVDGRVRVYLKPEAADYFELKPEAIRGVEAVPDPVPEIAKAPVAVPVETRPPAEAKLTTAELQQMLAKAGSEHNVDEDLLASLVKAESGGYVRARSRAGAQGLMQLMPGTARQLGVEDSYAPEENVRGGTAYLDGLLKRYHDNIALALAAYNAGPEAVDHYRGIPPYRETQVYVARVIHEFNRRVKARRTSGMNRPVAFAANSVAEKTGLGTE
jgi:soluble lytic murein transglycosylase-like protein